MNEEEEWFCPRLRWSKENGEDLTYLQDLWNRYQQQKKVLQFLSSGPKTYKEIFHAFQLQPTRMQSFFKEFRRRGVDIASNRYPELTYILKSDPKDYKFSYRVDYHNL